MSRYCDFCHSDASTSPINKVQYLAFHFDNKNVPLSDVLNNVLVLDFPKLDTSICKKCFAAFTTFYKFKQGIQHNFQRMKEEHHNLVFAVNDFLQENAEEEIVTVFYPLGDQKPKSLILLPSSMESQMINHLQFGIEQESSQETESQRAYDDFTKTEPVFMENPIINSTTFDSDVELVLPTAEGMSTASEHRTEAPGPGRIRNRRHTQHFPQGPANWSMDARNMNAVNRAYQAVITPEVLLQEFEPSAPGRFMSSSEERDSGMNISVANLAHVSLHDDSGPSNRSGRSRNRQQISNFYEREANGDFKCVLCTVAKQTYQAIRYHILNKHGKSGH